VKNFDEYDVVTRWRRLLIWRPGQVAGIKRRIRRRERRLAKKDAAGQAQI
jgi:hypothetical protein